MSARRFKVEFSDGVAADVKSVSISYTFENVIEAVCFSAATPHYLERYEERRGLIEAGRLKGHYCFEPELIDEVRGEFVFKEGGSIKDAEFVKHVMGKCFKDNKLCVLIAVDEAEGEFQISLEWYQTTRELNDNPLPSLIQQKAGQLRYSEIKQYCKFYSWAELE